MLNLIAAAMLVTAPVAIDDNLAGSYHGIYTSVSSSSFGSAFSAFWRNWLDNAGASFGGFPTPTPKTTPYGDADRAGNR